VNIDHIVIGPTGVFVIDAKAWTGVLTLSGTTLRQNGRARGRILDAVLRYADAVAEVAAEAIGKPMSVWPVVCFAGDARVDNEASRRMVRVVNLETLLPFIECASAKLSPEHVEQIATAASDHFRPYGVVDDAPVSAPADPVYFLDRWRKNGQDRIYVKAATGEQLGHLDLVKATVACDAGWSSLLERLLADVAAGGTPGLDENDLGAVQHLRRLAEGLFGRRRAAPEPVIVATRWRGHGKDRLYVKRLTDARVDLGWVDVQTGAMSTHDDVLRWCAQTHRTNLARRP
jgi:hypothetical protein